MDGFRARYAAVVLGSELAHFVGDSRLRHARLYLRLDGEHATHNGKHPLRCSYFSGRSHFTRFAFKTGLPTPAATETAFFARDRSFATRNTSRVFAPVAPDRFSFLPGPLTPVWRLLARPPRNITRMSESVTPSIPCPGMPTTVGGHSSVAGPNACSGTTRSQIRCASARRRMV